MTDDYSDIIHLPHPVSKRHPQMSMIQRAAQFSPFAALTGYDASVKEEARLTESQETLGDDTIAVLNHRVAILRDHLQEHPLVSVTYFRPDSRKAGGEYLTIQGHIQKMDDYEHTILVENHQPIAIQYILDISGALFDED